jgi:RNA polymerase sigma-70 factor (ECF subfamily)
MVGHVQSNLNTAGYDTTPLSPISDKALVRSIADGNKAALKLLYLRHRERVYRFVVRITGVESLADELVNDVFLAAWRHAQRFEGKCEVATWLLSIARYRAISACRRSTEVPLDERAAALIEDPMESPASSIERRQRVDILRKCLAKLTPVHRDVIDLIYYRGNKIEQVARATGAPVSTVKTRLHYARIRLAELLIQAGVDRAWVAV